jgi:hypothetical protein
MREWETSGIGGSETLPIGIKMRMDDKDDMDLTGYAGCAEMGFAEDDGLTTA